MMTAMTRSRVEHWERRSEVPLLLLAVGFLVAYVWPVLDPELPRDARSFLVVVSWTVWAAFAVDFSVRIALADRRGEPTSCGTGTTCCWSRFLYSDRCDCCGSSPSSGCSTEPLPDRWPAGQPPT